MRSRPTAAALGASLYVPGSRTDLVQTILSGQRPDLRSVIVCLEDSVAEDDAPGALANVKEFLRRLSLQAIDTPRPWIFVRPRSPDMLDGLFRCLGAERVDGFVLPKITADNLATWLRALRRDAVIMPTVETAEAFDPAEMRRLRGRLERSPQETLVVRIGGNDLLQLLGARRSRHRTAYDGPLGPVIAQLAGVFAPAGFALSAPVFEAFGDAALLLDEVERDLEHGLVTKSAIHPGQVSVIQSAYAVDLEDLRAAHAISEAVQGVFSLGQVMCEPATHGRWAQAVLQRASLFGVRELEGNRVRA